MAVDSNDPRPVLRQELARVFKNQRVIRAFEKIFDLIPPEFIDQQAQIDAINLISAVGATQANAAIDAINQLTSAVERLAVAPVAQPVLDVDTLTPPTQTLSDLVNLTSYPALDTTITVSWSGLHTFAAGLNATGTVAVTGNITATTTIAATGTISGSNLSAAGGANPSALVGTAAVNGAATTFMRSDGAPALDQNIAPTWTGLHTHSNDIIPSPGTRNLGSAAARWTTTFTSSIQDGAVTENLLDSSGVTARIARGTSWTTLQFGNATANPAYTFLGTSVPKHGGNQLIQTSAALTNNAAAAAGTLLNAPIAGNPTKWIPINDNGTIRNIPAW